MATSSIVTTTIKSTDNKSASSFQSDFTTHKLKAPIEIIYAGSKLTFPSVTEFQAFLVQVLYPTANNLASSSLNGVGYSGLIAPSVATDAIVD